MIGNTQTAPTNVEAMNPPADWQQLALENGCLRVIISELLMKNQTLRWALRGHGSLVQGGIQAGMQAAAYDPRLLTASEGTPLCKKSRTAGMP